MDNKEIDYKKAAEQFRNGEALFGKDGALAPMLKRILNAALAGEMDAHLCNDERTKNNRRNGKVSTGLRINLTVQNFKCFNYVPCF